ncbi:hypothetical protein [Thioclava sp. GXIMD4216]|uniref:Uncharacterized protein n=1 Tax=Thioclava litoralis TaxID=3076557 RepID=A0ABZ1DZ64_9RHOB|nr:hypothetical protein RPE78_12675 [Thioclava sp. FTW29]
MKWSHVEQNWTAFYEAITDRWPDLTEDDLEEIDGDRRAFIKAVCDATGDEAEDVAEELREWLAGELPSDVVMDPTHDDHSIRNSAKYVGDGEDEYDEDENFGDDEEEDGAA